MREQSTSVVNTSTDGWSRFFDDKSPYRWGAVLVSAFDMPQGPRLAMILRPDSMKIHGGQIAFPGGSVDKGDFGPWDTACREANEEIGVKVEDLEFLGYLQPEDVLVSGFKVVPVLARGKRPFKESDFSLNQSEVARLILYDHFALPLDPLIERGNYRGIDYEYPVYPLGEGLDIWGATARILRRSYESGLLSMCV
ncbi:MAG: CoA pyrophosphatase [Synergistales bacterium]|nr:CoA pyrophosphatase [Synergistales bacterium]